MNQFNVLPLQWRPLRFEVGAQLSYHLEAARDAERRLDRLLDMWEGTPYSTRAMSPGVGASCAGFVASILCAMYRRPWLGTDFNFPQDACFHDKEKAAAGLRWFLEQFPKHERAVHATVEPGDIVVVGPQGGGPGHALLVGPAYNTLWHVQQKGGVQKTGWALPEPWHLHSAWRLTDKAAAW